MTKSEMQTHSSKQTCFIKFEQLMCVCFWNHKNEHLRCFCTTQRTKHLENVLSVSITCNNNGIYKTVSFCLGKSYFRHEGIINKIFFFKTFFGPI